jgi:hypothetical protein
VSSDLGTLTVAELALLRRRVAARAKGRGLQRYRDDPVGYATDILNVDWWHKQREIAEALVTHARVMVRASHGVGKTHGAGGIVNWWFDTHVPSIALTTAPTSVQVRDLLWREIRAQRRGRPGMLPKAPRMEFGEHHYAVGYTANDDNAFQGRHEEDLLILFDEAVGVAAEFWEASDGMLSSGEGNKFLAIYNPTDTSSAAYDHELSGDAHVIIISALDHPNIAAQLQGLPKPYPKAVDLSWVDGKVRGERPWCTPIDPADAVTTDIEWPPGSGTFYRPGALFESRVMGLWPSKSVGAVWSEAAFMAAVEAQLPEPTDIPCEIGCDVARFGDDDTVMHVRRGPVSLHHEAHNGWDTAQTARHLKLLANQYGRHCGVDGTRIAVKVDDDGVGGGVIDQRGEHTFLPVNAGTSALEPENYPNRRSELWFTVVERALRGELDLSRLPVAVRSELRRQCMAPRWKVDSQGRRVVERKDETKKRIQRSPDDADAMNLAYAYAAPGASVVVPQTETIISAYGADRRSMSRLGLQR